MNILSGRKLCATIENGNSKNNLLDSAFKETTGIRLERINAVGTYLAEICMLPFGKVENKGKKSYADVLSK